MSSLSKAHHVRQELCTTRPAYRSGRQLRAVKVYTISQESCYLLVQGIPALGFSGDLIKEFALYGAIEEYRLLDEYPADEFTEVMWIKYVKIQSARIAKRKLDDYEFRGSKLHVCYAPEYETIDDTRHKLEDRRRAVARRIHQLTAGKGKEEAKTSEAGVEKPESESLRIELSSDNVPVTESSAVVPVTQSWVFPSSSSVGSVSPAQLLSSSSMSRPPPPVPPVPPSFIHPFDFISSNLFPQLPPPPVEHVPVRLPPGHISSDVRWGYNSSPHYSTGFHPPFQPPLPPHASRVPPQLPVNVETQLPPSSSVRHASRSASRERVHTSSTVISGASLVKGSNSVIVKDFKQKGPTPRFIPRQLSSGSASSQKGARKSDPVNVELKQNAFILGSKVQGPSLPGEEEARRQEFKLTETGSESVDKTVHAIRQKVSQLSDMSSPPAKKLKEV